MRGFKIACALLVALLPLLSAGQQQAKVFYTIGVQLCRLSIGIAVAHCIHLD